MGNGLTTDVSSAADHSPGGYPLSSSLTSTQDIQNFCSSTTLDAAVGLNGGASPAKPTTSESVAHHGYITRGAISTQPSSGDDGNTPSLTKVADIGGRQFNQTPPSPVMEDTMLDFLKQLREERRAHQKNLEKSLIGILEEAHLSMNLRLDRMQESFSSQILNQGDYSREEVVMEENAEIEKHTDDEVALSDSVVVTQAKIELHVSEHAGKNYSALSDTVESKLIPTVADHVLVIDSKLEEIKTTWLLTAEEDGKEFEEAELLKHNDSTTSTRLEPTTQGWNVCQLNLNQLRGRTLIFHRGFQLGQSIWMEFYHASAALQRFTKGFFHLCTGPYTVHQISSQGDVGRAKLSVSGWTFFTRLFLHQWLTTHPSSILCRSISFQRFESRKEVEDDANSSFNLRNSHRFSLRRKFTSFDVFMVIVHQESLHGSRVIVNL